MPIYSINDFLNDANQLTCDKILEAANIQEEEFLEWFPKPKGRKDYPRTRDYRHGIIDMYYDDKYTTFEKDTVKEVKIAVQVVYEQRWKGEASRKRRREEKKEFDEFDSI
jgi:hypothetical protein